LATFRHSDEPELVDERAIASIAGAELG